MLLWPSEIWPTLTWRQCWKQVLNITEVMLCSTGNRGETIKGATRPRRSKAALPMRRFVEGRDIPLPTNWSTFLSSADNKADLAHSLSEALCSQAPVDNVFLVAVDLDMDSRCQVSNRHNWFGSPEIHTWRSWHKISAACRPQTVSYICRVFKRHWWSPTPRITLSKYAMSVYLDEIRHIKEMAVYTHWCSFQQTTKKLCSIISRIDWVRHHLLHRESNQAVIMEDLQRSTMVCWRIWHWWTHGGNHTVFRKKILQNIQCSQNRICRCSTALNCSPRRGNQKQWPWQVMCSVFTLREYTIKRRYGEMTTAIHVSSMRPQKWDEDLGNQDCSLYWCHWATYQTVASRWSPVRVVNNTRFVAANARNQDSDAHSMWECQHQTGYHVACTNRH